MGDQQVLLEKLFKWFLIAGAAGLLDPSSTDTLRIFSQDVFVSDLGSKAQPEVAMNASIQVPGAGVTAHAGAGAHSTTSIEAKMVAYRDARDEAEVALRLLQGLRSQIGLPEVNDYIGSLNDVVAATPDSPSLDETRRLAHWLRAARGQLVNRAGSFRTWLMIAELLDPNGGPHPVPARFVRWEEPVLDPVLDEVASKVRVRRALASFLGDDVHPAPGRA